jgi:hypothetical protein
LAESAIGREQGWHWFELAAQRSAENNECLRVNLDEIGANGFDFVDKAASVVGLFYDDGTAPDGRTAIDDGASKVDFRRWLLAGEFGAVSGGIFLAAHEANSGDAIGDVERKLVYIVNVDVHVAEPRMRNAPRASMEFDKEWSES